MNEMEERNVGINAKIKESKTSDSHNTNSKLFGNMPRLTNGCFSVLILIINIFLPGVGTMILGCCLPNDMANKNEACYGLICMGALQLVLSIIIIGWIWSILFGIVLVQISCSENEGSI